jgi:hypothetical protein
MPKRKSLPKCKRTGKAIYDSEGAADQGIMFIWSRDPSVDRGDLHSYPCEFCKKWHIGHVKGRDKRANRAMENVIQKLKELGWQENGETMKREFRMPTQKVPLYGKSGGELVTLGGRQRFKRGDYFVTVGGKTTFFYKKDNPIDTALNSLRPFLVQLPGKSLRLETKNLDAIVKASETDFK